MCSFVRVCVCPSMDPLLWVEACIDFDCDYVDVNGEVPFTHRVSGSIVCCYESRYRILYRCTVVKLLRLLQSKWTPTDVCHPFSISFIPHKLTKNQLIGLHDWAKQRNVIICPNAAGAGGLPDIAAFYTCEALKEKSDAAVQKMHCFLFGNGGTPSVRDVHSSKAISPSTLLHFSVRCFFLKEIHHVDDAGRNTCYARSHDFGDEGRARSHFF